MQIHDITRRKKVAEGLLDNVKAAITTAKTGASDKQGVMGKVAGAVKSLSDPYAYSAAKSDQYAQQIEKYKGAFDARLAQAEKQQAERQYQNMIKKFGDGVIVFPGEKLKVKTRGGVYYKTSEAKWIDGAGNPVDNTTAAGLEKIADSGQGKVLSDTQVAAQSKTARQTRSQTRKAKRDQEERMRQYNQQQQEKLPVMSKPVQEATTPEGDQAFKNEMFKIQKLNMADVKRADAKLGAELEQALDTLAKSRGKPDQFRANLKTYVDLSVRAANVVRQSYGEYSGFGGGVDTGTEQAAGGDEASKFNAAIDSVGIDNYALKTLGRQIGVAGQPVSKTQNAMLNRLLQQLGARLL